MLRTHKNWAERMRDEGRLEGQVKGRLEGSRDLLVRLAGERFSSSTTRQFATRLQAVSDPKRLEQVGVWLVTGVSGDELLARLGDH